MRNKESTLYCSKKKFFYISVAEIGFRGPTFSVSENSGEITLLVDSDGLNPDPVRVRYFYDSGTAQGTFCNTAAEIYTGCEIRPLNTTN